MSKINIDVLGRMLVEGLPFTGDDVQKALSIVISRYKGSSVIEDERLVVDDENSVEILARIAASGRYRDRLKRSIIREILEHRDRSDEYDDLYDKRTGIQSQVDCLTKEIEEIDKQLKEIDQAAVPNFPLSVLEWRPDNTIEEANLNDDSEDMDHSGARWTLDVYYGPDVIGPKTSVISPMMMREEGTWNIYDSTGLLLSAPTPSSATRELLSLVGLTVQRSSTNFWDAKKQEQKERV